MTPETLNDTLTANPDAMNYRVSIPKFSLDTANPMKEILQSMGINKPFVNQANFRKMSATGRVKIDEVQHRAVITVDEEGTEAAAATGVGMVATSMPPSFEANRPFMFVVRDKVNGSTSSWENTVIQMGTI